MLKNGFLRKLKLENNEDIELKKSTLKEGNVVVDRVS